jgi:hypothetical protein
MIFTQLSSSVIRNGLVSKLAFSLGFKLIASHLKAQRPLNFKSENGCFTNEYDYTPKEEAELAKRKWVEFKEWAESNDYSISTIEEIAEAYMKGVGKPLVKADEAVLSLRARVSGSNVAQVKLAANKAQEQAASKIQEQVARIVAEFSDIKTYANEWYHTGAEGDDSTLMELSDIILDDWVAENLPKVIKAQVAYWTKYNNWDDTELVFIEADQQLVA